MNKILLILGICGVSTTFAATLQNSAESSIACQKLHDQMRHNHEAIDKAYDVNDACTMGKLMIQNRQLFESHPECFSLRARKMFAAPPAPVTK